MSNTFNTVIDTVAIKTDINNIKDFTKVNNDRYDFINRIGDNFDNSEMKLKINLHTKYGECNINKLDINNKVLVESLESIGICDMDKVKLDRIDIALDTNDYDFNVDFKKLLFAFELLTVKRKKASRWYTTNLNTYKANTIKLYDSRYEVEIYNKSEESKGTHPYKTRIEFRYKRLTKDIADTVDFVAKTLDTVEELDKHLPMLEGITSNKLISLWEVEQYQVKSFSEFVRKYNQYFYTLNILKVVYKASGLKGSYTNWIRDFRKTNNIEFYTTKDIKQIKQAMKKSLKQYIK